jgi:hypothetical protein
VGEPAFGGRTRISRIKSDRNSAVCVDAFQFFSRVSGIWPVCGLLAVLQLGKASVELRLDRTGEAPIPTFQVRLVSAVFFVLLEDEGVGHAGDVVADGARETFLFCLLLIVVGKGFWVVHPVGEDL